MHRTILLILLLFVFSISLAQIPTNGLVASYSLNGNADDGSGNGYHGRTIRARPAEDRFGNPSSALYFDGNSSYVRLGNILNSVFSAPSAKFTVTGWAKTQSYPTYQGGGVIISKTAGGTYGPYQWSIDHDNDGRIKWIVSSSSDARDYIEIESNTIPTNRWFHFAAVFDGSQQASDRMNLYVDGVSGSPSRRIGVLGTSTVATDQEVTIGAGHRANEPSVPNNQYCGAIDDIRIYDRVLSVAEIESCVHAENWTPPPPPMPAITAESPYEAMAGTEFWVEIRATNVTNTANVWNVGFDVIYTGSQYVDFVSADASMSLLGPDLLYIATPNEANGRVSVGLSRKTPGEDNATGRRLIRLKFRIAEDAPANTSVTFILMNLSARDGEGQSLQFSNRSSNTLIRAIARY